MFSLLVALLPLVSFLSPTPGQIISGSKVPVKIAVTNLSLVDYRTHPRLVSGQGHVHLWLDQTDLSKISAVKAVSDTYTFDNVKPGNHTLVAELVRNDHSSFTPPLTTARPATGFGEIEISIENFAGKPASAAEGAVLIVKLRKVSAPTPLALRR